MDPQTNSPTPITPQSPAPQPVQPIVTQPVAQTTASSVPGQLPILPTAAPLACTYYTGMTIASPHSDGLLQMNDTEVWFTDPNSQITFRAAVNQIEKFSSSGIAINLNVAGKRYTFKGLENRGLATAGAIGGGLLGYWMWSKAGQKSGVKGWADILKARGVKKSFF